MDTSFLGSSYDLRAVYPSVIDEEWFYALGRAFARRFVPSRAAVGWDARVSSPSLAEAYIRGLSEEGVEVVSLGLVATDMCHWSSVHYPDIDLAAMITASHNPGRYNGLKACLKGGVPANLKDHGPALRDIMASLPAVTGKPGAVTERDVLPAWVEHAVSFAYSDRPLRPLRVVADAGNGVAGVFLPAVAAKLGLSLDALYFEPDGDFPHHPANPLEPENLRDLIARVRETGADLGVAFDGDADRAAIVDETGRVFTGTQMTAIISGIMLARSPGAAIIGNTLIGDDARDLVRSLGGEILTERVGHVYIKERMRATPRVVFAGEHSGHYYFRDNNSIDSGLLAFLVFLRLFSDRGGRASELWDDFHTRESAPEINFTVRDARAVMDAVTAAYPDAELGTSDGVTLRYADWWANIRASSNEPLLRLNVEARDEKLLEEKSEELAAIIRAYA